MKAIKEHEKEQQYESTVVQSVMNFYKKSMQQVEKSKMEEMI